MTGHRVRLMILAVILLAGALVRLNVADEGLPYFIDPGEPQLPTRALRMLQTGDFNPHLAQGSLMVHAYLVVDVLHFFSLVATPETEEAFLTGLGDIETPFDTGWAWTLSHPSFLLWNRRLDALMGILAIWVVFAITRRISGGWPGLLSAGLLAVAGPHAEASGRAIALAPATTFCLLSLLHALVFRKKERRSDGVTSFILAGLAAAIRFEAAILLPIVLLVVLRSGGGIRRGVKQVGGFALLLPVASFLVGSPFVIENLMDPIDVSYTGRVALPGWRVVEASAPTAAAFLLVLGLPLGAILTGWGAGLVAGRMTRSGAWLSLVATGLVVVTGLATLTEARPPDTRTRVIQQVNEGIEEGDQIRIGIATEARFHENDLKRLNASFEVHPFFLLACSGTDSFDFILTASRYTSSRRDEAGIVEVMNRVAPEGMEGVLSLIEGESTPMNLPANQPGLVLLGRQEEALTSRDGECNRIDLESTKTSGDTAQSLGNDGIVLLPGGWFESPAREAEPGRLAYVWSAWSMSAGKAREKLWTVVGASNDREVHELRSMEHRGAHVFEQETQAEVSIRLGMEETERRGRGESGVFVEWVGLANLGR